MGMVLTEGEISTFQECVRRDLLTYVSYPSFKGATRCFAYPQFLVEDETQPSGHVPAAPAHELNQRFLEYQAPAPMNQKGNAEKGA